jgi:hypothetical protein
MTVQKIKVKAKEAGVNLFHRINFTGINGETASSSGQTGKAILPRHRN